MAYCSNCGEALPGNAHFCPECGHEEDTVAEVAAGGAPTQQVSKEGEAPEAEPPPKKGVSACAITGMALGCLTLVGIAVAAGLYFLLSAISAPLEETSDIYFGLISDGNDSNAYELTSPTFQSGTSERELTQFLDENPILRTIVETKFNNSRVENGNGYASGKIVSASGEAIPVEMTFTLDPDLGWQIDAIKFGDS